MEASVLENLGVEIGFQWDSLAEVISRAFRFTPEEEDRFRNKNIAKLIAAIPFLADCEDPKRTSISHLGTYVLSIRAKEYANAKPSDNISVMRRLELLSNFIGGDKKIIKRGMNLIAICMLSDYVRDLGVDALTGKYNPVSSGGVDAELEIERLTEEVRAVECGDMDRVVSVIEARRGFWAL